MKFTDLPVIGAFLSLIDHWFLGPQSSEAPPPLDGEGDDDEVIPPDRDWFNTRILTAKKAVIACSVCRNIVSRGFSDLADQLDSVEVIGNKIMPAGLIITRGTLPMPARTTRISVPNGRGTMSQAWVAPGTDMMSEEELGSRVEQLAETSPAAMLRAIGNRLRTKTSECCRRQVFKRIMPQDNKKRTVKDPHRVTRVPKPSL